MMASDDATMITAITIENFKGIGERFRLPIKPLTLLFGPNSGGKSTILQAIHYAREVLDRHNLDAERTRSGGAFVELGGFRNFVHKHDLNRAVTLGFELDLRGVRLPHYSDLRNSASPATNAANRVGDKVQTANVEFSVRYHRQGLYVASYRVEVGGEPVAAIQYSPTKSIVQVTDLNLQHPVFAELNAVTDEGDEPYAFKWFCWDRLSEPDWWMQIENADQRDALPRFDRSLEVIAYGGPEDDLESRDTYELPAMLSRLLVGPGALLLEHLQNFRYLGPLRETPPRDYTPPTPPDPSRWIGGMGAWDVLHAAEPAFVEAVSHWMHSPERLDTGYEVQQKVSSSLDHESDLWKNLMSGEAARKPSRLAEQVMELPSRVRVVLTKPKGEGEVRAQDVGVGISQVLPVVVACLESHAGLTAIEQPELHLHPRVQCELGDLLINGALGQTKTVKKLIPGRGAHQHVEPLARNFLVETHSEHLILRILRRIRETTRGQPRDGIKITPSDVLVCYVSQQDGQSIPMTVHIDDEGEFVEPWPDDFFEHDFYERFS